MSGHRLLTAVVAGLVAGASQLANAADLETAPLPVAAPVSTVVAPAYSWTGCYVGAQAGFGALEDGYTGAVNPGVINPVTGTPTSNVPNQWGFGALGGAQVGCNYQIGHFVIGIESDAWGSSLKTQSNFITFGNSQQASTKNPWDFDLTARAGAAFDHLFFYAKAGGVFGSFNYNFTSFGPAQAGSSTSPGIVLGMGAEYAMTPDWTVKAETDFLAFTSSNVNLACNAACAGPSASTSTISATEILFKLGANYKFY